MKTIQEYIDSLFLGIAETSQTKQLKEDLLASAEDRYEDLKSQGKSENESIGSVISEFGSIDELLEEMNIKQEFVEGKGHELADISLEETLDFIRVRRKGATLIGLGVMAIILGVAGMFGAMTLYGETFGESFGLIFIFLGVAIGVPLFIIAGTNVANFNKKLKDRFIPIKVKNEVKKRKKAFERSFIVCIVIGVILCILSVIPLVVLSEMYNSEAYELFGITFLLALVSLGVFFFIFGGVIMGSFTKLLEETYFISDEEKLGRRSKA